jgi:hypothetical protein
MCRISRLLAPLMLAVGLIAAAPAFSQQRIIVDGTMWLDSSPDLRKAFLVGAGNMLALETAYATRKNLAPPPAGAMTRRAVEGLTLDQLADRVTQWYQAHPDRHDVPVMGVIWIDVVKPTLAPPASK